MRLVPRSKVGQAADGALGADLKKQQMEVLSPLSGQRKWTAEVDDGSGQRMRNAWRASHRGCGG
jgi:hypothetical protein